VRGESFWFFDSVGQHGYGALVFGDEDALDYAIFLKSVRVEGDGEACEKRED
jgi:hypothetical protein